MCYFGVSLLRVALGELLAHTCVAMTRKSLLGWKFSKFGRTGQRLNVITTTITIITICIITAATISRSNCVLLQAGFWFGVVVVLSLHFYHAAAAAAAWTEPLLTLLSLGWPPPKIGFDNVCL